MDPEHAAIRAAKLSSHPCGRVHRAKGITVLGKSQAGFFSTFFSFSVTIHSASLASVLPTSVWPSCLCSPLAPRGHLWPGSYKRCVSWQARGWGLREQHDLGPAPSASDTQKLHTWDIEGHAMGRPAGEVTLTGHCWQLRAWTSKGQWKTFCSPEMTSSLGAAVRV